MNQSRHIQPVRRRRNESRAPDSYLACTGKMAFHQKAMADQAAQRRRRNTGERYVYYKCSTCKFYHVGHQDRIRVK